MTAAASRSSGPRPGQALPADPGILFTPQIGAVRAVDGVSFELRRGRDAGHRRRVRLRQVHAGRLLSGWRQPTAGEVLYEGEDISRLSGPGLGGAPQHPDRVPGPVHLAQPADDGRRHHRRAVRHPPRGGAEGRAAGGSRTCSTWSASTPITSTAIRTSSPAASASASASPGPRADPEMIVCDEPVSALDVSVQARWSTCWRSCRTSSASRYIFIAHDLSSCGTSPTGCRDVPGQGGRDRHRRRDLRQANPPVHPGAALRRAGAGSGGPRAPRADRAATAMCPRPANPPSGCRFRTRCWKAQERCTDSRNRRWRCRENFADTLPGQPVHHPSACHFAEEKDVVHAA